MRNFLFTINNPTEVLDPSDWMGCTYCVYQMEIGEEGTEHFQGYAEFNNAKSFGTVKSLPGLERAHIEKRKGSAKQARDYCMKEDTRVDGPYEWGICSAQGKRSDLEVVKKKLDENVPMKRVAQEHFDVYVKYHKAFAVYKSLIMEKRSWAMDLVFLLGPTGTGKTRTAMELAGEDVYIKPPGPWWDNYNGEHTIVWDEFYGHSYPFTELLQVLDRYPLLIPFKGGFHQFSSKRIIFTSNQEPENWYNGQRTHQVSWENNPLNRRIRDYGRIMRTGAIHVLVQPRLPHFIPAEGMWSDAPPVQEVSDDEVVPPTQKE